MAWSKDNGSTSGAAAAQYVDGKKPLIEQAIVDAGEAKPLATAAKKESTAAAVTAGQADGKATDALAKASTAKTVAETVQGEFDRVVAEAGSNNPEVVQARGGEVTLKARLDKTTAQLADTENILELKKELRINVKQPPFNAKGIPGVDDSDAIQSAINYAFSLGDSYFPIIEFGAGIFEIKKPLYVNQSGNYGDILGAGIRQTRLKATAPMACMMYVSDATGVHSRKRISGITFDGNEMVDCLLDGSYLRYSTVELNEFIRAKSGGWAVKLSNWVTRFLNNTINGQDMTGTATPISNGLLLTNDAVNNFIVQNNSFTSCLVGLQCNANPHDLSISQNTFDKCIKTGIWFRLGGRKVAIVDNYFEDCGKSGLSVEVASGVFETWYGAIVGHGTYNALSVTTFEELNIQLNEFAACAPQAIISLANLDSFDISKNHALKQYLYTHFVDLKWNGAPYYSSRKAIIDHSSYSGQFKQLVGLNGQDKRFHHSGLQINSRNKENNDLVENVGFELLNPNKWTILSGQANWISTETGYIDGLFPIQKIEPSSSSKEINIDLTTSKGIRGRYFNCNAMSKGDTGTGNGLWLKVEIDGVNILDIYVTSETWKNSFRNATFFVPETANQLRLLIRPILSTSPVYFTKFNISNASRPMENKNFLKRDI